MNEKQSVKVTQLRRRRRPRGYPNGSYICSSETDDAPSSSSSSSDDGDDEQLHLTECVFFSLSPWYLRGRERGKVVVLLHTNLIA